ncbi:hypothetical protein [Natrarchaeobius chitinivorans]|uniref:Uncharacterized protein n=1 Tax=Natrarchaeobius chitinivorans TaxID=1679083 RepID=A0A3N6LUY9_NATCH|nr:hypothetical protein [Natrarchaeobius chitinivorans]RQG92537.1 hypothetical protein EA473_16095 [Natrarchaeobius chitinivorans]
MSESVSDRIDGVLERVDTAGGALVSGAKTRGEADDSADEPEEAFFEAADEADEILESEEPTAILEAVGLGTLPDGTEPDSIPAAIAHGEPEDVETLRRLVRLARVADRSDEEELEGAVGAVRAVADEHESASGQEMVDEAESGEETEVGAEQEPDDESEGDGDSVADVDSDADLEERLRSAMADSFEEVSDDVMELRDRLEGMRSGVDDPDADAEDDDPAADGETAEDEDADSKTVEDDDGLLEPDLEPDLGTGGDRGSDGDGGGHYSTVAPSPSDRADMKAVRRHSTMPDRNAR